MSDDWKTLLVKLARRLLDPAFIEAVSKLLWPIAAVVIATLFRSQIAELLRRVRKAKVLGNEIELAELEELKDATRAAQKDAAKVSAGREAAAKVAAAKLTETMHPEESALFEPQDFPVIMLRWARDHADTEPHTAAGVAFVGLERAMQNALASTGERNLTYHTMKLAQQIQNRFGLSSSFVLAVEKFRVARNAVAHQGRDNFPHDEAREIAKTGVALLELILGLPYPRLYVDQAGMLVYEDKECSRVISGLEGVAIIAPAVSGGTGHIMAVVTDRLRYYKKGHQVVDVWEANARYKWPLWIRRTDGSASRKVSRDEIFVGSHIDEVD